MTFGLATEIDMLSWMVVLALGMKLAATAILLSAGKDMRDTVGWGSALWWITKLAPIAAVVALVRIAMREGDPESIGLSLGMTVFVAIAVPLKIYQRRARISRNADQPIVSP